MRAVLRPTRLPCLRASRLRACTSRMEEGTCPACENTYDPAEEECVWMQCSSCDRQTYRKECIAMWLKRSGGAGKHNGTAGRGVHKGMGALPCPRRGLLPKTTKRCMQTINHTWPVYAKKEKKKAAEVVPAPAPVPAPRPRRSRQRPAHGTLLQRPLVRWPRRSCPSSSRPSQPGSRPASAGAVAKGGGEAATAMGPIPAGTAVASSAEPAFRWVADLDRYQQLVAGSNACSECVGAASEAVSAGDSAGEWEVWREDKGGGGWGGDEDGGGWGDNNAGGGGWVDEVQEEGVGGGGGGEWDVDRTAEAVGAMSREARAVLLKLALSSTGQISDFGALGRSAEEDVAGASVCAQRLLSGDGKSLTKHALDALSADQAEVLCSLPYEVAREAEMQVLTEWLLSQDAAFDGAHIGVPVAVSAAAQAAAQQAMRTQPQMQARSQAQQLAGDLRPAQPSAWYSGAPTPVPALITAPSSSFPMAAPPFKPAAADPRPSVPAETAYIPVYAYLQVQAHGAGKQCAKVSAQVRAQQEEARDAELEDDLMAPCLAH
ncbi:hypothetical protein FOA52_009681 [Chlamydomonas sp. UWO 241]|nr:hypothetical protein FOA52_009681 [Chlamydomonas sp. UWO 241]